jgi:hypothetical protein
MPDDALVRWTVRVALAFYVAALAVRPASRPGRPFWTLGCLWYLAHVAAAFHFHHGWSHAAAYDHTARRTAEVFGLHWGGGLWWNYLFTAVWVADAAWLWVAPVSYQWRARWLNLAIHGFLGFLAFNATVVFASGPVRWAGLAATIGLAVRWLSASRARRPR